MWAFSSVEFCDLNDFYFRAGRDLHGCCLSEDLRTHFEMVYVLQILWPVICIQGRGFQGGKAMDSLWPGTTVRAFTTPSMWLRVTEILTPPTDKTPYLNTQLSSLWARGWDGLQMDGDHSKSFIWLIKKSRQKKKSKYIAIHYFKNWNLKQTYPPPKKNNKTNASMYTQTKSAGKEVDH